jgi:hypothetical protein
VTPSLLAPVQDPAVPHDLLAVLVVIASLVTVVVASLLALLPA